MRTSAAALCFVAFAVPVSAVASRAVREQSVAREENGRLESEFRRAVRAFVRVVAGVVYADLRSVSRRAENRFWFIGLGVRRRDTHREGAAGQITRVTGTRAFVRIAAGISNTLLTAPAITVRAAYRSGSVSTTLPIRSRDHPHFGEDGYWFGPHLGRSRAVTLLENWGSDAIYGPPASGSLVRSSPRQADYVTMYQLPLAAVHWIQSKNKSDRPYPGLGVEQPRDIRVECMPHTSQALPAVLRGTKGTRLTLLDGQHATLYLNEYEMGDLHGIDADIVVGRTVCLTRGLIPAAQFRAVARTCVLPKVAIACGVGRSPCRPRRSATRLWDRGAGYDGGDSGARRALRIDRRRGVRRRPGPGDARGFSSAPSRLASGLERGSISRTS